MGKALRSATFSAHDFSAFSARVQEQLAQLKTRLLNPAPFQHSDYSFGAELELYLVDKAFSPQNINLPVLEALNDSRLTEELNQYNLEINSSPVAARDNPFSQLHDEFKETLQAITGACENFNASPLLTGILPTLANEHLSLDCLTERPRYHALTEQLRKRSDGPFEIAINHHEQLSLLCEHVTLEGANTSFQVHFRVPEDKFVDLYNTAQLVTPLVLAISANSPIIMEKQLWDETRIALFKQSIDHRNKGMTNWRQPARVSFGQGWVRHNPWELFAESVALYEPILPYVSDEPRPYGELLMHHGTVWTWNRAVFDAHANGHMRIEFRSLPAGPTVTDMLANAALIIGLTQALSHNVEDYLVRLPFQHAEYNFYRAAKHGLNAKLLWPSESQNTLSEQPVTHLLNELLPLAEKGLSEVGVPDSEIKKYLSVIDRRLQRNINGAIWQRQAIAKYENRLSRHDAIIAMLKDYQHNMRADTPIHTW